MFNITRIYSDQNGDSHFEDRAIVLKETGPIGFLSEPVPAKDIIFREVLPSYDFDFHNAPQTFGSKKVFFIIYYYYYMGVQGVWITTFPVHIFRKQQQGELSPHLLVFENYLAY